MTAICLGWLSLWHCVCQFQPSDLRVCLKWLCIEPNCTVGWWDQKPCIITMGKGSILKAYDYFMRLINSHAY